MTREQMHTGRASLCLSCRYRREVVSGKGSRFLLCRRSQSDPRFPKYPMQPVRDCPGHVPEGDGASGGGPPAAPEIGGRQDRD